MMPKDNLLGHATSLGGLLNAAIALNPTMSSFLRRFSAVVTAGLVTANQCARVAQITVALDLSLGDRLQLVLFGTLIIEIAEPSRNV